MKHRPRKIISPKRVEFLLDGPVYYVLLKRLEGRMSVSEYMRIIVTEELSRDFSRRMDTNEYRPPEQTGSEEG